MFLDRQQGKSTENHFVCLNYSYLPRPYVFFDRLPYTYYAHNMWIVSSGKLNNTSLVILNLRISTRGLIGFSKQNRKTSIGKKKKDEITQRNLKRKGKESNFNIHCTF